MRKRPPFQLTLGSISSILVSVASKFAYRWHHSLSVVKIGQVPFVANNGSFPWIKGGTGTEGDGPRPTPICVPFIATPKNSICKSSCIRLAQGELIEWKASQNNSLEEWKLTSHGYCKYPFSDIQQSRDRHHIYIKIFYFFRFENL